MGSAGVTLVIVTQDEVFYTTALCPNVSIPFTSAIFWDPALIDSDGDGLNDAEDDDDDNDGILDVHDDDDDGDGILDGDEDWDEDGIANDEDDDDDGDGLLDVDEDDDGDVDSDGD